MINHPFNPSNGIVVRNVADNYVKPLTEQQIESVEGALILESVSLEDVEETYLYDFDSCHDMFEAITSTKMRLDKTMAAFRRSLDSALSGTELSTSGAFEVGKPRKSGGFATMTAQIGLSDGQTMSVIFHAPDEDPAVIKENDQLIAFRFLMNKRDVTHTVAPAGGRDISLKQVTTALSNLAERNSSKFVAAKETQAKQRKELETTQAETEKLESQTAELTDTIKALETKAADVKGRSEQFADLLETQKVRNDQLEKQLKDLGGKIEEDNAIIDGDGATTDNGNKFTVRLEDIQTASMLNPAISTKAWKNTDNPIWRSQNDASSMAIAAKLTLMGEPPAQASVDIYAQYRAAKADGYSLYFYRQAGYILEKDGNVLTVAGANALLNDKKPEGDGKPTVEPTSDETQKLYYYGMGVDVTGKLPKDSVQIYGLESRDSWSDELKAFVSKFGEDTVSKLGAVSFTRRLTDEELAESGLFDFNNQDQAISPQDRAEMLDRLKGMMRDAMINGTTFTMFYADYVAANGRNVAESPFIDSAGNYRSDWLDLAVNESGLDVSPFTAETLEHIWNSIADEEPEVIEMADADGIMEAVKALVSRGVKKPSTMAVAEKVDWMQSIGYATSRDLYDTLNDAGMLAADVEPIGVWAELDRLALETFPDETADDVPVPPQPKDEPEPKVKPKKLAGKAQINKLVRLIEQRNDLSDELDDLDNVFADIDSQVNAYKWGPRGATRVPDRLQRQHIKAKKNVDKAREKLNEASDKINDLFMTWHEKYDSQSWDDTVNEIQGHLDAWSWDEMLEDNKFRLEEEPVVEKDTPDVPTIYMDDVSVVRLPNDEKRKLIQMVTATPFGGTPLEPFNTRYRDIITDDWVASDNSRFIKRSEMLAHQKKLDIYALQTQGYTIIEDDEVLPPVTLPSLVDETNISLPYTFDQVLNKMAVHTVEQAEYDLEKGDEGKEKVLEKISKFYMERVIDNLIEGDSAKSSYLYDKSGFDITPIQVYEAAMAIINSKVDPVDDVSDVEPEEGSDFLSASDKSNVLSIFDGDEKTLSVVEKMIEMARQNEAGIELYVSSQMGSEFITARLTSKDGRTGDTAITAGGKVKKIASSVLDLALSNKSAVPLSEWKPAPDFEPSDPSLKGTSLDGYYQYKVGSNVIEYKREADVWYRFDGTKEGNWIKLSPRAKERYQNQNYIRGEFEDNPHLFTKTGPLGEGDVKKVDNEDNRLDDFDKIVADFKASGNETFDFLGLSANEFAAKLGFTNIGLLAKALAEAGIITGNWKIKPVDKVRQAVEGGAAGGTETEPEEITEPETMEDELNETEVVEPTPEEIVTPEEAETPEVQAAVDALNDLLAGNYVNDVDYLDKMEPAVELLESDPVTSEKYGALMDEAMAQLNRIFEEAEAV